VNPGQREAFADSASRVLHADAGWTLQRDPGQVLRLSTTAPEGLRHLQRLLAWGARFSADWATVPLRIEDGPHAPTLTLSDPGGQPLAAHLGTGWTIERFLAVAAAMAQALAELHAHGLLHQHLEPASFLIDEDSSRVWLTGFWRAVEAEPASHAHASVRHGPYAAPEQSGLMHRGTDPRSDLYALGVCFYQMLAGERPFEGADAMELVHAHLARTPTPLATRVAQLPSTLSDIVMRLLAKAPEDRYQTANGLAIDLRLCARAWSEHGHIDPLVLGGADVAAQLHLPQRLYGREAEIEALQAELRDVSVGGGARMVLIAGPPGVGKTALAAGLQRWVLPVQARYVAAKATPQWQETPYAVVVHALQTMLGGVLGLAEPAVQSWREALQHAVGRQSELACALVPDLALLLAPGPPRPALAPAEQRDLVLRLLLDLIQVFARPREPLVLFIDDLQWLDAASLDLIEHLASDTGVRPLLIVGAYRGPALAADHPLAQRLPRWRGLHPPPLEINVGPLKAREVSRFVEDTLRCPPGAARALAAVLRQRTGGNPLFVAQLVATLAERALLHFDLDSRAWQWDLARIDREIDADSVTDLLLTRLARLPARSHGLLADLACLGGSASLTELALASDAPDAELHEALAPALALGLVRTVEPQVAFVHDRVRESVLASFSASSQSARHLAIARRLHAAWRQQAADTAAADFAIAGQYNLGASAIRRHAERDQVAHMNLATARRARTAGAPASALSHAAAGLRLLGQAGLKRQAGLGFELRLLHAECAVLVGEFDTAEQDLDWLQARADEPAQLAAVARQRVVLQVIRSDYAAAVASALLALRGLGTELPAHPDAPAVDAAYQAVTKQLGERAIESLVDLPVCEDPIVQARMDLLSEMFAPACFTDLRLAMLHLCEMVRLSLTHGVTPASGHGFAWFGVLIGQTFGAYREGHRFAHLAQLLTQRHGHVRFEPKALFAMEITSVWARPIGEALATSRATFQAGATHGDVAIACFACHHTVNDMLVRGDSLDEVAQAIEHGLVFVRRARFRDVEDELLAQQRFVAALRGLTAHVGVFDGDGFTEAAMEASLTPGRMPTMAFWYWVLKAQARFLTGRIDEAGEALAHADPLLWSAVHVQVLNHELYSGLVAAQAGDAVRLRAARDRFAHWALHNPVTFDDKLALLEAETARLEGRVQAAMIGYERAADASRAAGAAPYEALSALAGARMLEQQGLSSAAQGLLQRAHGAWVRWGAMGLARELESRLPPRMDRASAPLAPELERLDLAAVMKLAQTLAGEIELERLVDTLMRLALEHAGAGRALLLRADSKVLTVEAVASSGDKGIDVSRVPSGAAPPELPWTVVQYVARTRRSVLIEDVAAWHTFSTDEDLQSRRPRSVFCLPLLRQTRLVGLLHLENSLSSHVFTRERSALLELLASQAAIALENARLYDALLRENHERRQAEAEARRINQALQESEGRFRLMAETSLDVIWITDLSPERVLYASPSFERIWGRTLGELYADPRVWTEAIHPDDRAHVRELFERWIGGDSPGALEMEFRVVRPDGSVRWIDDRGAAILDAHGRPYRISGIASDTTARHLAEAALRASEERFSLAVAGSRDGVWDLAFDTGMMFMSERAQQIFGLEPGESTRPREAWMAAIALHPEDRALQQVALTACLEGQAPEFDGEWRVLLPDGGTRWMRVRGVCVFHPDGRPHRLAGSVSDINDQKRAQASLQQSQRLEAVGTLASGIAHDFNNILGAILGFGEMCLQHARSGSRLRRDLECIVTAGERGRALVERILAFSRSGSAERVPVHLEGVVREALQLLAPTLPAAVRLDVRLDTGSAAVLGDPTQVHQVVLNLATNALHAMPQGGTLSVSLHAEQVSSPRSLTTGRLASGDYLVLAVEDNGTGIAPDIRDRIFDPFVTTRKAGTGSGLGLSLVHGIVAEAGGAVNVISEVGQGSRFEVFLPRTDHAAKVEPLPLTTVPRGRHQQVLVVDDEPLLVRLITETLSELGYMAVGFTSPVEAVAAFQAHPERFDALVTDERMPDVTGTELLAMARSLRPDLPVLLLSGYLDGDTGAHARRQGVHVLGKPVMRQELAATLARALIG